jgi:hypothetical protein
MLRRRGKIRPEDLARLDLAVSVDLGRMKATWTSALQDADEFINGRPSSESGCLYYSVSKREFVDPDLRYADDIISHYGSPGGVLPRIIAG